MNTMKLVCFIIGCTMGAAGCYFARSAGPLANGAAPEGAGAPPPMPPLNVSVTPLQQRDVDMKSVWFGHLRGVEEADIRPEVSGKLLRRVYEDGAMVQEGDVLFEIDPATYRAAVGQAEAAEAVAEAAVLQAAAEDDRTAQDVARYTALVETGSVSQKALTDAQQNKRRTAAALAAAKAQVKQAKAALEAAQINLDRCTIRAPFTGLASAATVSVGDFISPSRELPLTTMSSVDPIRVNFSVPAKHAMNLHRINSVESFELLLEDGSTYGHTGKVVAVDSEVSSATGTVKFIGRVDNPDLKLLSGAPVRVSAKTGVHKDALLVPVRALVASMNHHYIYVVAPDNKPLGIDVQLGEEVVLEMPTADGGTAPMLMQVVTGTVKPIAEQLKEAGIDTPTEAQVVVEGGKGADRYAKMNGMAREHGQPAGLTLVPHPFVFTPVHTITPSVTAKHR